MCYVYLIVIKQYIVDQQSCQINDGQTQNYIAINYRIPVITADIESLDLQASNHFQIEIS